MSICGVCKELISALPESILCDGPCGMSIHARCTGLNKTAIRIITESPNVIYLCNGCVEFSSKAVAEKLNAIQQSIVDLAQVISVSSEKTEVLSKMSEKLSNVVAANTVKTDELSVAALTPTPSTGRNPFALSQPSSNKRRRLDASSAPAHLMTPRPVSSNLVIGSAEDGGGLLAVESRKLIVASLLHNSTTADQLLRHINSRLALGDNSKSIRVNLLLPANRTVDDLDFVSFKLSVPESLYSKIIAPEVWPKGVTVREFVHRNNNVRRFGHFLPAIPTTAVATPPVASASSAAI